MNIIVYSKYRLFSLHLENEMHRLGYFITNISSEIHLNNLLVENYDYIIICTLSVGFDDIQFCNRIIKKFRIPVYIYSNLIGEDKLEIIEKLGIKLITDIELVKEIENGDQKIRKKIKEKIVTLRGTRTINKIEIDFNNRVIKKGDLEIELSGREIDLLKILVENRNCIIKKDELIEAIWNGIANDTNVYITIQKLRKKIEVNPQKPDFIITKKGGGYMLKTCD